MSDINLDRQFPMRHQDLWRGIDRLAERNGLTPSGLAKQAGLDATAFNPSKRTSKDGRPRWPSTESVARALAAVGAGFDDLAHLIEGRRGDVAPLIGFAQAGADGFFDDAGFPVGEGWEEVRFPGLGNETVYALEISGDSMGTRLSRRGQDHRFAQYARPGAGDRIVTRTHEGEVMAKVLGRRTESSIELLSLNPEHAPRQLPVSSISFGSRASSGPANRLRADGKPRVACEVQGWAFGAFSHAALTWRF